MLPISRRHAHFVFGVIQSGLTSLIAAGVASYPMLARGLFFSNWMKAWVVAWAVMLPVVLFAAPGIRWLAMRLTRESGLVPPNSQSGIDSRSRFQRVGNDRSGVSPNGGVIPDNAQH